MTDVWILLEHVRYEGSRILGVFADEAQAKAEAEACKAANDAFDVSYYVSNYEVTQAHA